ncbi:type I-E CRISPR-associated protein Cse2/CasB [Nonomuraea sp. NPDC049028]|uniref:type I-E CRISPR-associated protein Cse2/CasB n=1 Tax=Nonomuraea sp. NPDC049028 TaxID=3364348 RepID=UPI00370FC1F4
MTAPAISRRHRLNDERKKRLQQELDGLFKGRKDELLDDAPAILSRWRRGLSHSPDTMPVLAMQIANVLSHPEERETDREAQAWEAAVHYGLGLFAVHQQSQDRSMHQRSGPSLGAACRLLTNHQAQALERREFSPATPQFETVNRGIVRRLESAMSSVSAAELVGHVRGLVPMLRQVPIVLDYVQFTAELAAWAHSPSRGPTALRWGRHFYAPFPTGNKPTTNKE